ncbi:hypothetical protein JTB14_027023 [Gonioctena quinquepunctata]|nr:hypothetical protein JTB14_027023 [Gonioctena quinquepunctata]
MCFTRKQRDGESVEQFVTDLKNKARLCEFGDLKESLTKDIMICGLQSQILQKTSPRKWNHTGGGRENVSGSKKIPEQLGGPSRNRQDSDSRRQPASRRMEMSRGLLPENNGICYNCGSVHGKNQCPAFGRQCRTCGLQNHFAKVCRKKNINQVEVESSEKEEKE